MKYRKFGKLDWQASVLGFGGMRLPLIDNNPAQVDEAEAIRMIRYSIDNGVNYIDTGFYYHGGKSEVVVGKALKDGYLEKVKVVTKMPVFAVKTAADFDRFFEEQLKRLDVPRLDFYMLHGLNAGSWQRIREMGIIKWAENKMAQGYFHHFAFSFHDEYPAFKEIVDSYDNWTFTQVLYNYMDIDRQATTRGVKYAAEKGLGVVVMEPLRGGVLSQKPPEKVAMVWQKAPRQMSLSEWGLQWVWNHPEISVVLSGMSSMQQVQENIAAADRSGAGNLNQADIALINSVRKAYRDMFPVAYSGCRYCMPCPNDVSIPTIFEIYNEGLVYDIMTRAKLRYKDTLMDGHRADKCIECNKCVEVCPQKIAIPEQLKKAHEILTAVK